MFESLFLYYGLDPDISGPRFPRNFSLLHKNAQQGRNLQITSLGYRGGSNFPSSKLEGLSWYNLDEANNGGLHLDKLKQITRQKNHNIVSKVPLF